MEYLEDYECDRTEEIIRYTWNSTRYANRRGQQTMSTMGAGTRCRSRLTMTPSSTDTSMSVSIQSSRCLLSYQSILNIIFLSSPM